MYHLMIMIGKSGKKTKLLSFKNMNNNCEDEKFAKKFKISFSIKKI